MSSFNVCGNSSSGSVEEDKMAKSLEKYGRTTGDQNILFELSANLSLKGP